MSISLPNLLKRKYFCGNSEATEMRFYPDSFPQFDYEPTTDRFAIQRIGDSVGEGIVSLVHFNPGDIVFRFTGFLLNEMTLFTLQYGSSLHIHDPYFMGKTLHSCDPNLSCDMSKREFTAVREINPGDLLTMDYEQTEDALFRGFECGCGSSSCRGLILGRLVPRHSSNGISVNGLKGA